jgi:V8-like Glu-specific endopeptidase
MLYEIFVRKGDKGAPFVIEDQEVIKDYAAMLSIAKDLVNKGEVDEAVLIQKRVLKRMRKYGGNG